MKKENYFSTKVSRFVSEINEDEWAKIMPPYPAGYGYFKTIDETLRQQFKTYYISIYDKDEISCIATCFIAEYSLDTTFDAKIKKITDKVLPLVRKILPNFLITRAIICGCPINRGMIGIKDSPCRDAVIETLITKMRSVGEKENASFIAFRDFAEEYTHILKPLLNSKFHKILSFPFAELKIEHKSFEDYFSSLSKATKIDLRRKFKKTEGKIKIDMEVVDNVDDFLDEIYDLYLQNIKKSDVTFEIITKDFFKAISRNAPGISKFFLWRIDGKLVAFHLCLVSGGILSGEYLGIDYGIAYDYHIYFVLMTDIIKWCIKNDIKSFDAGALSYDPKKRLDFQFVPQYLYVKHRNSIVNFLFRFVVPFLKPENSDPVLKSLKKEGKR